MSKARWVISSGKSRRLSPRRVFRNMLSWDKISKTATCSQSTMSCRWERGENCSSWNPISIEPSKSWRLGNACGLIWGMTSSRSTESWKYIDRRLVCDSRNWMIKASQANLSLASRRRNWIFGVPKIQLLAKLRSERIRLSRLTIWMRARWIWDQNSTPGRGRSLSTISLYTNIRTWSAKRSFEMMLAQALSVVSGWDKFRHE